MALVLTCTKCGQRLSIPDELKGRQVRCPKCSELYLVERKKAATSPAAANPQPAAKPAANHPVKPRGDGAAKPGTTQCPDCSQKMRLPASPGTSTFKCPGCSTPFTIRSGQATRVPQAVVPVTPVFPLAATVSDSLLDNLPATIPQASRAATAPLQSRPTAASMASTANVAYRPPAAIKPQKRSGGGKKLLGPGLLIAIPYALALLAMSLMMLVVIRGDDSSSARDTTVFFILFGAAAVNYLLVIGGAIGMISGVPRWLSTTTCIIAIIPSIFLGTFCFGFLLYPFALGGAIWGLVELFGKSKSPAASPAGGGYSGSSQRNSVGSKSLSNDYMQQARSDAKKRKSSSDESAGSSITAVACLGGGILFLGFSVVIVVALYLAFTDGDAEVRRPGRAIGGLIFCLMTSFSLLGKGAAYFMNR